MPQERPQESPNKEALNALTDLYYLFGDLAFHVLKSDESPQELDIFYVRPGGMKELLHKYYTLTLLDPEEAGSNTEALTLERMLPFQTISQVTEESWGQIQSARGDLKEYNNAKQGYGTPVPQEVQEVVDKGRQMLDRRKQSTIDVESRKLKVVITSAGIGIKGDAERYYALRGGRKKAVLEMLEKYPEVLSAKAWARLVGKTGAVTSDLIQQVSADVNDINKRFKKNLQLENSLIVNRNGYVLNHEELDIEDQT